MKHDIYRTLKAWWPLLLLAILLSNGTARAAGTPAGTVIRNIASGSFRDGNGNSFPVVNSNEVSTVVSQVAAVDVSPATQTRSARIGGTAAYAIRVTNLGNGTDTFGLGRAGLPVDWAAVIYRDLNRNGVLDPDENVPTNVVTTVTLDMDSTAYLAVKVTVPGDATDGQTATETMTATSDFDGLISDSGAYTTSVTAGVILLSKTATPTDPRPGDVVTYTIEYSNTGSDTAFNTVITDAIPVGMTYEPESIRLADGLGITYENSLIRTDTADPDSSDFGNTSTNTVTVTRGNISDGESGTVFFRVRVNDGAQNGTLIDNVAALSFEDPSGIPAPVVDSPPATVTVQFSADVVLEIPSADGEGEPGESITHLIIIKNTGNDTDVLNLIGASSEGFPFSIWVDANRDGISGNDGDFVTLDSNADGVPDVGSVPSGDSLQVLVVVNIAAGTADSTIDVVSLTLSSGLDPEVTATGSVTTLVHAPAMIVVKSVSPTGSQPPGQELTYTVILTNDSQATAVDVRLQDPLPAFTTYAGNSVTVQGLTRTDTDDGDDTSVANDSLKVVLGDMTPGEVRTVTFRTTIDNLSLGATVSNTAFVGYTDKGGAPFSPESNEVRTPVSPSITKSIEAIGDTLSPGDSLVYVIVVSNTGGDAVNLALSDTVASILQVLSVQGPTEAVVNNQIVTAAWTPYEADRSDTIRIITQVPYNQTLPGTVQNQAWLDVNGIPIGSEILQTTLVDPGPGADGEISQPEFLVPGQNLAVTVRDADRNRDSGTAETIVVSVTNDRSGEVESVTLTETGPDTGEFVGLLATVRDDDTGQDEDGLMHVLPDDNLDGLYIDEITVAGPPQDLTARTLVLQTTITLDPNPRTIVGNGVDQSILTARVVDSLGDPLPDGTPVTFTTDKGTFPNGLQTIVIPISGGNGEALVRFTAPILSEPDVAQVFASFGGSDSDTIVLEVLPGAVAIRVWDQVRGVEVKAGDPDLTVEVTLFGTSVTGQPVSYTVTVDQSGVFVIPEIPPGTYQLQATVTKISDGQTIFDGILQSIVVNFDGSTTAPKNGISGQIKARGEEGGSRYAGLTVELVDALGNVVGTTTVDDQGRYDFQGLDPDEYNVRVTLADGEVVDLPITNRTLLNGALIVNANILIDPFGQTFDGDTGALINGITVSIETMDGQVLPIPALNGTGAAPNADNINPYITTFKAQYAFLFGGDQVGTFGNPVTYRMLATPPNGSPYLPRMFYIDVEPLLPGPITNSSTITLRARSADGLELALPNTFTLTTTEISVPDIAVIAINIPMFTTAPILQLTKATVEDTLGTGVPMDFAITVSNAGNDVAQQVTISDTLDVADWLILDAPGAALPQPNIAIWSVGDLQPGESDTLNLRVEIVAPQANGVTLLNTAFAGMNRGMPISSTDGVLVRSDIKTTDIVLTPSPRTIIGNGSDFSILTARVVDNQGNPLPDGTLVTFTADKGTFPNGLMEITIPISGGNGEAVVVYTSPILTSDDVANVFASFDNVDSDVVGLEVLPGAVGIRVFDQVRGIRVLGGDAEYLIELRLTGATVNNEPISHLVSLDDRGIFAVPEIPPGTYQVEANIIEVATGRIISDGLLQQITVNFDGSTSQPKNAVSGTVRGNGESSGARYAGLSVDLLDAFGLVVQSDVLDAEGRYDFQGIDPGGYSVRFTLPDGQTITQPVNDIISLSGAVVINVEVLIDPFGQTYDAVTGALITGVTVTLETPDGTVLTLPPLAGTGATPNLNNINPFVTDAVAKFAFLFGGDQVGTFGSPVTYLLTANPPIGSPYLPRRMLLNIQPVDPGPITSQSQITLEARSADGLEIARSGSFALTGDPVTVPDIAIIALNIPLFTTAPVLQMTKNAVPDTLSPGEQTDFVIVVTNIGNATALDVTVSDTLSRDWQLIATTPPAVIVAPNAAQWVLGDIAAGQTDSLTITAELLGPQLNGSLVRNVAHAESPTGLDIDGIADLAVKADPTWEIIIRALVDTVGPGQEYDYVITIQNVSDQLASGFTLIDSLPPEVEAVAVTNSTDVTPVVTRTLSTLAPEDYLPAGVIATPVIVNWPIPDMAPGAVDSSRFTVRAVDTLTPSTIIVDRATIVGPTDRVWAASSVAIGARTPRLTLLKEASEDTVRTGNPVEFSLIVRNDDIYTVSGASIVDSLGASMKLISSLGKPTVSGQVLSWVLGDLAPGQSDTLSVTVEIESGPPVATNTAWIDFLGNRIEVTADVAVEEAVALSIVKQADATVIEAGQLVQYTITVTASTDTLSTIAVADTLPFELAYVEGSSQPAAVYDTLAHVLNWTLTGLLPSASQDLVFTVTPRGGLAPGEHTTSNVAVAVSDSASFSSGPADVIISVPFFTVSKKADRSVAETGDFVIYRVTIENLSPNDQLTDIVIRDRLPHGFDYIAGTSRLDGQPLEPVRSGPRDMTWQFPTLDAGASRLLSYRLVLGADALSGDGTNVVLGAAITPNGFTASAGPAQAKVRVRPDIFSQGQIILGRAWIDENENGLHDQGEPPVPGIALLMEDGTRIIADLNGRFSIPEVRSGSHVLRLVEQNVPTDLVPVALGTRSAQDPWIRFVDVSPSGLAKANFPFRRLPIILSSALRKSVSIVAPEARIWIERSTYRRDTESNRGMYVSKMGDLGNMKSGPTAISDTTQAASQLISEEERHRRRIQQEAAGATPKVLDMAYRTAVRVVGPLSADQSSFTVSQEAPPQYTTMDQEGRLNRTVPVGDTVFVDLAADMMDLPDLPAPTVVMHDLRPVLDSIAVSEDLPAFSLLQLTHMGRATTDSTVRDVWFASLKQPDPVPVVGDTTEAETTVPDTLYAGGVVSYDVTVFAPRGGELIDALPKGLTPIGDGAAADTLRWSLPDSTDRVITTLASVGPEFSGDLTNTAVLMEPADPDTASTQGQLIAGLTDSASVFVRPRPNWGVRTTATPETLLVEISNTILQNLGADSFISGSAVLTDVVKAPLLEVRDRLLASPTQDILIAGHTDSDPINTRQFPDNDALSLARSNALRDWLVAAGVDSSRIITRGFGPRQPVATNETSEGKRRNRRVELELVETVIDHVPYLAGFTRVTTVTHEGTEPIARMEIVDELGAGIGYVAGTSSIEPMVAGKSLLWILSDVQPGESFSVSYRFSSEGEASGNVELEIPTIVSYSLPDGQWVTEAGVVDKSAVIVPLLNENVRE